LLTDVALGRDYSDASDKLIYENWFPAVSQQGFRLFPYDRVKVAKSAEVPFEYIANLLRDYRAFRAERGDF